MAALIQADLLDLLRRTTDPTWLDGLLETTTGQAVLNAILDMGAEAARDSIEGCETAVISLAPGGRPGVTVLRLTRSVFATAVTIPAGYTFRSIHGTLLRVPLALLVPGGTQVFDVPLQSVLFSEMVNTFADPAFPIGITGSAASDPGAPIVKDLALNVVLGPPGTVVNTEVVASDDIQFSVADWLSVLGNERGQKRQAGELEEDYRLRVRNIPDTVSPKAIAIGVNAAGIRVGVAPIQLLEPFRDGADLATRQAYNLGYFDPVYASGTTPASTSPGADFLDDYLRPLVNRKLACAYFELDTPASIRMPNDQVFFCDAGFLDDFTFGYTDQGTHPAIIAALMSIWEEAERKRAACVNFDVVLPLASIQAEVGATVSAVEVLLASFVPSLGTSWLLVDTEVSHAYDVSTLTPLVGAWDAPFTHRVRYTFTDATTFSTPTTKTRQTEYWSLWRLADIGMPIGKHIALIELLGKSNGVLGLNAYCQSRVLTVTE